MQRAAGRNLERASFFNEPRGWARRALILALCGWFAAPGCASAPAERGVDEAASEPAVPEQQVESTMAAALEGHLSIVREPELGIYLSGIAESLSRRDKALAARPVGVMVIEDRGSVPRSFAIPGNRVYLSKTLLKSLEFESEIAALIALQLAHVELGHPLSAGPWKTRMTEGELFGPAGALTYGERQVIAAVDAAARMLYTAGIDPRGLVSICSRLQNGGTSSPYDPALLEKMRQRTREVLARFAPLRNPVIRSEAFFAARERIRRL